MEDEVQKLLDFSFDFAKDILLDTNDIYPFASVLNKKGEVRHVGFQGDEDHEPVSYTHLTLPTTPYV